MKFSKSITVFPYLAIIFISSLILSGCSEKQTTEKAAQQINISDAAQAQKESVSLDGIYQNPESVQPLSVGNLVPNFKVRTADGNEYPVFPDKLDKPVILTFFRGGWCPYCNRHLAEMRTAETELKEMGFDVWFISIDKPEHLYESLKEPGIGYTLFSDSELEATRTFGIGFTVDDATYEKYIGYGIDLDDAAGFSHHVLPAPSTFILGKGGRIHFQYTNPDYKIRLAPEELLKAAKSYTASH